VTLGALGGPFTPLEEALARLDAAVSPLVGIVTHTLSTTSTTDETSLPNCACELASGRRTLGVATVDYGSGANVSFARARAAAIGEAVERYSGMFVPHHDLVVTTARRLGPAAPSPERFALFHEHQHRQPRFPFTPFTLDTTTEFVEGFSLEDGATAYLPAQLVYLRQPGLCRPIAYSTSSGLACAPTLAEAVLAALLEVVERDAVMLAWKCRLSLPLLDWSLDETLERLDRRFFRPTGLRFEVVDGSCFLDAPVAIAVVHGPPGSRAALAVGAGAGASVTDAWLKALSEGFGVHRWLGREAASAPDAAPPAPDSIETFDEHMLFYSRHEQAALAAFLTDAELRTPTSAVPGLAGSSPADQIAEVVARLGERGLGAYAVDVTSPDVRDLGLSVVRVVAPELCALDVSQRAQFLGGRRLYTAAHEAGLVAAPLRPEDLNPLPHPFP
jgi:ribosomal protein S12 methylthiotransferase accessory factor